MLRTILSGAIAGAAGELVLNVVSYGDMLVRARPASSMPGTVAGKMADLAGVEFAKPGERPDKAEIRKEATGALLGYVVAITTAVAYALLRRAGLRLPVPVGGLGMAAAATLVSDSTATALGATDPRTWGVSGWLSDIIPHASYGLAAAAALEFIEGRQR
jgi:hypothetical protein